MPPTKPKQKKRRSKSIAIGAHQNRPSSFHNEELVFNRLFEQGQQLKSLKEDNAQAKLNQTMQGLFIPKINQTNSASTKSRRGRTRAASIGSHGSKNLAMTTPHLNIRSQSQSNADIFNIEHRALPALSSDFENAGADALSSNRNLSVFEVLSQDAIRRVEQMKSQEKESSKKPKSRKHQIT